MKTASELEHDAERARADLDLTLSELRSRMEPGRLFDQALTMARENGGTDFARNAARQARDNPLPVLLIGAGLAWLMSGRVPATSAGASDMTSAMAGDRSGPGASDRVQAGAKALSDAASGAASGLKSAASAAGSGLRDLGDGATRAGSGVATSAGSLQQWLVGNPIALGALGAAAGAVLGAFLPASETEKKTLGPVADDLKASAEGAVKDQMERAKDAVTSGLEATRQTYGSDASENPADAPAREATPGPGDTVATRRITPA